MLIMHGHNYMVCGIMYVCINILTIIYMYLTQMLTNVLHHHLVNIAVPTPLVVIPVLAMMDIS